MAGVVQMEKRDLTSSIALNPSLLCPACSEFFSPPIFQCSNGHSLCSKCTETRTHCSECNVSLASRVRNITLERILESVEMTCRFEGCAQSFNLAQRKQHEEVCEFNPFFHCVYRECQWVGDDLIAHLKASHDTKEFHMNRLGGVRGWNSKTWRNADWGFSIWNFGGRIILNKSMSTGEIFCIYLYDIERSRLMLKLGVESKLSQVLFTIETTSIRNIFDTSHALPFHISIREAERYFLEPAEGLEEGYKRLSINVSLIEEEDLRAS